MYKKHFIIVIIISFGILSLNAEIKIEQTETQINQPEITSNTTAVFDTIQETQNIHTNFDSISVPEEITYALDHALSNYYLQKLDNVECDTNLIVNELADSTLRNRLKLMPCIMEMPYNASVKSFVDMYIFKRRKQMSYMLGLGDYYYPIFEEELNKHDLPLELKYLPVIESALNPVAISRAGAAGLWQFMPATARMYGLEINSIIDERLDPHKSTKAAVKFLKDLYEIYNDWHLVIAAYNCGPGNVNKAIRRSGGKRDYWAIYPFLPRETRGYVPIFIAANYAMHYAYEHNICKSEVSIPIIADTIMINQRIHFEQIAQVLNLPKEQVKAMNPQFRREIIPGDIKPYAVVLPLETTGVFIDNMEEIIAYKADSLIHNRRNEVKQGYAQAGSGQVIYHTVSRGQTLSGIAARYGVSVRRIQQWNNLQGTMIRTGQRLKIHKS